MKRSKAGTAPATNGFSNNSPVLRPVRAGLRLSAPELLQELKAAYDGRGNARLTGESNDTLGHIEKLPARPAVFQDLNPPLPLPLSQALSGRGITRLYTHQ